MIRAERNGGITHIIYVGNMGKGIRIWVYNVITCQGKPFHCLPLFCLISLALNDISLTQRKQQYFVLCKRCQQNWLLYQFLNDCADAIYTLVVMNVQIKHLEIKSVGESATKT